MRLLGAGWVLSMLRRLDWIAEIWKRSEPELAALKRRPSEQIKEQDVRLDLQGEEALDDAIFAVLTDDQKARFEKLKGPKFEMDMSQFFGRGRRGRRHSRSERHPGSGLDHRRSFRPGHFHVLLPPGVHDL